jgi:hypothetical protein
VTIIDAESLDRLIKLVMDTGEARTFQEAQQMFSGYRIGIWVGQGITNSSTHQATLFTLVQLGKRVFQGGLQVAGTVDVASVLPLMKPMVRSELESQGVSIVDDLSTELPVIAVGGRPPTHTSEAFSIRTTFDGWCAGLVPASENSLPESAEFVLSGIAAAALAINEAFLYLRRDTPEAGQRRVGLSLWRPESEFDWERPESNGPPLKFLPSSVWIIGLGHLGQAFLWTLGLLPYAKPFDVELVLQDFDAITPSSESTSILSSQSMVGMKKTRAMANWLEERGFRTKLIERPFDGSFKRLAEEPTVAFCGIDNALGRLALEDIGFDYIIEAGLGRGAKDFRAVRIHTFPGNRRAKDIWNTHTEAAPVSLNAPAYQDLLTKGLDECGVTLLAGKAVGAPFVGVFTASLVAAELLRLLDGGQTYTLFDLDLKILAHRSVIARRRELASFNPGFTFPIVSI